MAEIFVTPTTKCRDIVQRLQRQIREPDCFLLEVWQGCGRLHAPICLLYEFKYYLCWSELQMLEIFQSQS